MSEERMNRFHGCLLGLAVGDAVGTTVEFSPRGSFELVTDMTGGGPFNLKAGQWTDDTSMALCLGQSLLDCNGFDSIDQMSKYSNWWRSGYMSSTGECFDIGNTTRNAVSHFAYSSVLTDRYYGSINPNAAGNGSIMRLAPIPMFYSKHYLREGSVMSPDQSIMHFARESSKTTHGAPECVEACEILAQIISRALAGYEKDEMLCIDHTGECQSIVDIADMKYANKGISEISGSGYVVESLEAALWCFHTTSSFKEAILKATNLGDDADTTAAICGQVAGAYYGEDGGGSIPSEWLAKVHMYREIKDIATDLMNAKPFINELSYHNVLCEQGLTGRFIDDE